MRDHKLHHFDGVFLFLHMQKIQTIIFDLGGVIINLKTEQQWINEDLLPNFQPDALHKLQESDFFRDYETGKIDSIAFVQQLKQIANNNTVSDIEIKNYWNGILKDIPFHRFEILKKLKERYQLILLSNTNEIHLNEIYNYMQHKFGDDVLTPNFHHCYYSQEIGLRKPNRAIYEYVLENEMLRPENCLFLDDKTENLIEPKNLGILTHHVNFNQFSETDVEYLF